MWFINIIFFWNIFFKHWRKLLSWFAFVSLQLLFLTPPLHHYFNDTHRLQSNCFVKKKLNFFPFYQFFHIIMFWCYVCSMKYWTFLLLRNQFTVNCVLRVNKKIVMRKLSHFLLLLLFFIKYFNIYEQNNLKSPIYIDKY